MYLVKPIKGFHFCFGSYIYLYVLHKICIYVYPCVRIIGQRAFVVNLQGSISLNIIITITNFSLLKLSFLYEW